MKKNVLILFAIMLLPFFINAENNLTYTSTEELNENQVELISSTPSQIIINVKVNAYNLNSIIVNNKEVFILETPEGTPLLESGAPDLPKFTESVIIPDMAKMKLSIISSSYIEINNIDIAPSKGNFTRDIDPQTIPYQYGKVYSHDAFYPNNLASLRTPYILRDYRGQTVVFTPFQYNPVTKTLRIYTNFTIELKATSEKSLNTINRTSKRKSITEFSEIYKNQFLNFNQTRYTPVGEDGEMLIISHPDFIEAMEPFVAWKIQRGMETTIIDVTTIGNATAIKTYITTFYNNTNLSYVLLVGDHNFVPTITAPAGHSDNSYGYLSGNDSYPEVFVGRFSAENVPHVNTMVDRSISYELNPTISAMYGKSTGIGSSQGPGDDGEMDYEHIRNMQTDLNAFTYTSSSEFFDGSQGGLDASGNPSASAVGTDVNSGTGIMVYTGHGSTTSWSSSGFSNSNVNSLTNTAVFPFIWSVACVNGNFVNNTCFAEAWTRASSGNQPTGAIAALMSTINQSWNPPMCAEDEMVDILTESYTNNIKRSFGGLSMNGCMQMNDEYGSSGTSQTDTWNCFGDPSVMVRTAIPTALVASHASTTFIGTTQFQVNSTTEGALVSLTIGNSILGTELVTGGIANISFPTINSISTITVTVTAFNKVPYVGYVDVVPNNGPYVISNSIIVQDPTGNNNQLPDYSENITLDIVLTNIGIEMANAVSGTLSTTDSNITITTSTYTFGNIDSNAVVNVSSAFSLTVADLFTDQHIASFTLELVDNLNNTWTSNFSLVLNSPILDLSFDAIDDAGQIENGRLDPDETVNLELFAFNNGHASSTTATCEVTSTSPYVTINNTSVNVGQLAYGSQTPFVTSVTIAPNTPVGTMVGFTFNIVAGVYSAILTIEKKVGLIVEDWETNDFTNYSWSNDNSHPWTITGISPFEGNYMAKSGSISDSQSSTLMMTIDVLTSDTVSFYKKVSCEPAGFTPYDYLEFFIDNVSKGQWDGEVDWSKESFPIGSGYHVLKWVYSKDNMVAAGQDCAWIDFIVLPPLYENYAPEYSFSQDTIDVQINTVFSYIAEATDLNTSDALAIGAGNLPGWLFYADLGNQTAELSGVPSNSDLGYHNVELWVTDGIADTVTSSLVIKVYDPVGIDLISSNNSISIYPNPVQNIAAITVDLEQTTNVNMNVYNVLGEIVLNILSNEELKSGTNNLELDTHSLTNGIYFIRLHKVAIGTDANSLQQKMIIAR